VGLLKKKKKKKSSALRFSGGGGSGSEISPQRPQAVDKLPPCVGDCPSGNDVRGWLTAIALREKHGLSLEEAFDQAWMIEVETNPFPGVMGRVCPHPCEQVCNRTHKDGAVAINSVERTIGDWGIERNLELPALGGEGPFEERIAVVGAGPSGLSCAYQLARRGYKVTIFDAFEKPGGMLRYGIPAYRLPREVLDAEIQRILDQGVELRSNVSVGKDVTLDELREQYDAVFVGIGAHSGKLMGIPGEDGPGVFTGTEFLNKANSGKDVGIGNKVVVVGGGDTAIDAARVSLRLGPDAAAVSRRMGAEVTILYRRTRAEMPAIEREIEEALEENINIEYLAAPVKVIRDADGKITKLAVQRMELGEPDDSGRRRPLPIEGDVYEMETDTLVMAVSQAPDWATLGGGIETKGSWLEVDEWGRTIMARGGRVGPHGHGRRLVGRRHVDAGTGHDLDRAGSQGRRIDSRKPEGHGTQGRSRQTRHRQGTPPAGLVRGQDASGEESARPRSAPGSAAGRDGPGDHSRRCRRGDDPVLQLRDVLRLRELLDVLPEQLLQEDQAARTGTLLRR